MFYVLFFGEMVTCFLEVDDSEITVTHSFASWKHSCRHSEFSLSSTISGFAVTVKKLVVLMYLYVVVCNRSATPVSATSRACDGGGYRRRH